jgi:hypothetical protein
LAWLHTSPHFHPAASFGHTGLCVSLNIESATWLNHLNEH